MELKNTMELPTGGIDDMTAWLEEVGTSALEKMREEDGMSAVTLDD